MTSFQGSNKLTILIIVNDNEYQYTICELFLNVDGGTNFKEAMCLELPLISRKKFKLYTFN